MSGADFRRAALVARMIGPEPAFAELDSAFDAGSRGWVDADLAAAVTQDDLELASELIASERRHRADQLEAIERLGWMLSFYEGTVSQRALALAMDTESDDALTRNRAKTGVVAMAELHWIGAGPHDPWTAAP